MPGCPSTAWSAPVSCRTWVGWPSKKEALSCSITRRPSCSSSPLDDPPLSRPSSIVEDQSRRVSYRGWTVAAAQKKESRKPSWLSGSGCTAYGSSGSTTLAEPIRAVRVFCSRTAAGAAGVGPTSEPPMLRALRPDDSASGSFQITRPAVTVTTRKTASPTTTTPTTGPDGTRDERSAEWSLNQSGREAAVT